jgi:FlaA1/EpsC-like NDP-sugar epimerase
MKRRRQIDVWFERACHLAAVGLSVTAAFLLRFDFAVPYGLIPILKQALLIAIVVKLPIFDWVGFYRGLRRFVSIPDLYLVFLGNLAGSVLFATTSMFWIGPQMPRSVLLIDWLLCFIATALVRAFVRICNEAFVRDSRQARKGILYKEPVAGARSWFAKSIPTDAADEVRGFLTTIR